MIKLKNPTQTPHKYANKDIAKSPSLITSNKNCMSN